MKNYVVIGASSAIGAEMANDLIGKGHQVFGTKNTGDINNESVNQIDLDVLEGDYENFKNQLPEVIDGLVYCPGTIDLKPFHRTKPEEFIKDYELQTLGAIKAIQAILPALKKSSSASVVLFSTVAVQTGFAFHSLVSSSKGALEGLVRSLAAEYAPKIRFNAVAPSLTNTPLAAGFINNEKKLEANANRHPLKRVGEARDIAKAAIYLLTDAEWTTGQVLQVDGGISSIKG